MMSALAGWLAVIVITQTSAALPQSGVYAGHQVVFGARDLPLLGERDTRTDTFVIARIDRQGEELRVRQEACKVDIREVAGVSSELPDKAAQRLPATTFTLRPGPERGALFGSWTSRFGDQDDDGDGEPGVTIKVGASLCSGEVYVASQARTRARAQVIGPLIQGEVDVEVSQQVLGASNVCLKLGGKTTEEQVRGVFLYALVPPETTCASLRGKPWPIRAVQ